MPKSGCPKADAQKRMPKSGCPKADAQKRVPQADAQKRVPHVSLLSRGSEPKRAGTTSRRPTPRRSPLHIHPWVTPSQIGKPEMGKFPFRNQAKRSPPRTIRPKSRTPAKKPCRGSPPQSTRIDPDRAPFRKPAETGTKPTLQQTKTPSDEEAEIPCVRNAQKMARKNA